ncbi:hypothetical protein C8R43DRAFT_956086 [Mycena crocata]|nr:hypothetical protein C8R43DRAFT_956086 [Mycena crocata]
MHVTPAFAILCTFVVASVAAPSDDTTLGRRDSPTCGTAPDAVLSDCKSMLNSDISLNYDRTCTYGIDGDAYNPVCSPGNCCFYTTHKGASVDDVKKYGNILLGCGDTSKNKVNGRVEDDDGNAYCLSDGSGCGDCLYTSVSKVEVKLNRTVLHEMFNIKALYGLRKATEMLFDSNSEGQLGIAGSNPLLSRPTIHWH